MPLDDPHSCGSATQRPIKPNSHLSPRHVRVRLVDVVVARVDRGRAHPNGSMSPREFLDLLGVPGFRTIPPPVEGQWDHVSIAFQRAHRICMQQRAITNFGGNQDCLKCAESLGGWVGCVALVWPGPSWLSPLCRGRLSGWEWPRGSVAYRKRAGGGRRGGLPHPVCMRTPWPGWVSSAIGLAR